MKSTTARCLALAIAAAPLTGGCAPDGVYQEARISDVGGFIDPTRRLEPPGGLPYCAEEVLRWRYDEAEEVLRIADARVPLACCGERALTVERVDSLIEITERDRPRPGRCDTSCVFDFAVTLPAMVPGPQIVRLLRDVSDAQGGPVLIWQGELHLHGQTGGSITLDSKPAPDCWEHKPRRPRLLFR